MNLDEIGCEERTAKASYYMNYLSTYEELFKRFDRDITLLEIGVWEGASMRTWRKYFPDARIIGLDINPKVIERTKDDEIEIVIGDQSDLEILKTLPSSDIIIDDGSHKIKDFVGSFKYLFHNKLKKGGIYIIEDLHCVYEKEKYENDPNDFLKFLDYLDENNIKYTSYKNFIVMYGN